MTKKHALAAKLVAEDELSDNKIAAKVGISVRTLYYWKQTESFQGWVSDVLEYYGKRINRLPGLAQKRNRFIKLCQLAHRMDQIIKERFSRWARPPHPAQVISTTYLSSEQ